jgi:histidinol dehydrogenase
LRLARVELLTVEPQRLAERLDCAAVVSLGPWSPLALAEAVAGACALVPSLGVAGAHGALTAHSFCRASYEISVAAEHYPRLAAAAGLLAEAQGLPLRGAALVDGARGER